MNLSPKRQKVDHEIESANNYEGINEKYQDHTKMGTIIRQQTILRSKRVDYRNEKPAATAKRTSGGIRRFRRKLRRRSLQAPKAGAREREREVGRDGDVQLSNGESFFSFSLSFFFYFGFIFLRK